MQQYFVNRTLMQTKDLIISNCIIEDKIFANERVDKNWKKERLLLNNCTFAKMGFKDAKFNLCDFSFCVFIDCYFKKAEISQTNFKSCIFIRCNFDLQCLIDCNFEYASFDNCFIPYKQMKNNLPEDGKENL